jgi:hypothetical protein
MTITTDFTAGIIYRGNHGRGDLPTLNVELLTRLLEWAEFENDVAEGRITRALIPEEYHSWGEWEQGVWAFLTQPEDRVLTPQEKQDYRNGACQTAFCMAGQAAAQAGYRMLFTAPEETRVLRHNDEQISGFPANWVVPQRPTGRFTDRGVPILEDVPGAQREDVGTVGRQVIGLSRDESDCFFEGSNSFEALCKYANTFCAARSLPPIYPGLGMGYVEDRVYLTSEQMVPRPDSDDDYDDSDDDF